eukprot:gnl/TRDRNA2_/TRDRNA2_180715_c0_seq1.p1 gnl/TRDRNA2_/TRDRNA2_180715_c0~~gnl/TRDRNA2_/TRDRNA2_180715_c0_seq1.p1  ORF type:complete len:297 (-),score=52.98 gnl/TRDRNA2_/TRDRNA2_180715_c0_seq1:178-1011(-)
MSAAEDAIQASIAEFAEKKPEREMDANSESDDDLDNLSPMQRSLDETMQIMEEVRDLQLVSREMADGRGKFEALHNCQLSRSLMSGTFEWSSNTGGTMRYDGTFLNDPESETPTPHGQGVRCNPDGSTYCGQWKNGLPDGSGEWKASSPSCASYVGDWKAGKRHGFGIQKFETGDMYEGDWANGCFQDRGKYTYANGDEFLGIWSNGVKLHGSFYFKDGRISRRTWQNGKLITCQDFDSRKRCYVPTHTNAQIHDPARNAYGNKVVFGMISPRGVKI